MFPYGPQITLVTKTVSGTNEYGEPVYGESTTTVQGAFAPGASGEITTGQDQVITQPTVYLPFDVDLSSLDAVEIDGVRYEVDGQPNSWQSPFTGWQAGTTVPLRRQTG